MDSLEKIEKLADVFTVAITMLQEEIEENKENYNTFEDIQNLVKDWNAIVDENIEEGI